VTRLIESVLRQTNTYGYALRCTIVVADWVEFNPLFTIGDLQFAECHTPVPNESNGGAEIMLDNLEVGRKGHLLAVIELQVSKRILLISSTKSNIATIEDQITHKTYAVF
jgi:hypothetical protein